MLSRLRPHDGPEVRTPIQSLDIQYTVGLASNVPVTFVSVGGNNEDIDEVNFLLQQEFPAKPSPSPNDSHVHPLFLRQMMAK